MRLYFIINNIFNFTKWYIPFNKPQSRHTLTKAVASYGRRIKTVDHSEIIAPSLHCFGLTPVYPTPLLSICFSQKNQSLKMQEALSKTGNSLRIQSQVLTEKSISKPLHLAIAALKLVYSCVLSTYRLSLTFYLGHSIILNQTLKSFYPTFMFTKNIFGSRIFEAQNLVLPIFFFRKEIFLWQNKISFDSNFFWTNNFNWIK